MAIRWEKLTVKTQQAIQEAQSRAAELSNPELQPVHLLLALMNDREGVVPAVLEKIGVPTEHLESDLRGIEQKLPRVAGVAAQPSLSQATTKVATDGASADYQYSHRRIMWDSCFGLQSGRYLTTFVLAITKPARLCPECPGCILRA